MAKQKEELGRRYKGKDRMCIKVCKRGRIEVRPGGSDKGLPGQTQGGLFRFGDRQKLRRAGSLPVMEPDVSPFAPATAGPEWKDTVGRTAKGGETSCRSGTCREMPRCFGVPKLRHGTAHTGRRLSALASPYLVMQSELWHRHSADSGWESRPEGYIKGRGYLTFSG